MIYDVYVLKNKGGRVPSSAWLDEDYTWAGDIEATSPKDVVRRLYQDKEDLSLAIESGLGPGDVVVDEHKEAKILTPNGIWAEIDIFFNESE